MKKHILILLAAAIAIFLGIFLARSTKTGIGVGFGIGGAGVSVGVGGGWGGPYWGGWGYQHWPWGGPYWGGGYYRRRPVVVRRVVERPVIVERPVVVQREEQAAPAAPVAQQVAVAITNNNKKATITVISDLEEKMIRPGATRSIQHSFDNCQLTIHEHGTDPAQDQVIENCGDHVVVKSEGGS